MIRRAHLIVAVAVLALVGGGARAATSAPAALHLVTVAEGLKAPVFVTSAPGEPNRLYVVEQGGLIKVIEDGSVRSTAFLDLTSTVVSGGEQGLLGLAFAPDYATSRQFVVDYTDRNGDTRVVRYRSDGTVALRGSARQLLFVNQPYENHNGGMVAYGRDRRVYVGMGDGGAGGDPQNRAQSTSSLLGKILRLDPAKPGSKPVIVAVGVRNPWRFSFDRLNGDLWIGDVGQEKFEEIDRVPFPASGLLNFGWDVYEARASYESKALGPGKLVRPIVQFDHNIGCSVTGGYVYRGKAVPAAAGRYFYGDYCSGIVWSLKLQGGVARQVRRLPFTVANLTSFGQDEAGELYLVSGAGTIYRLAP